MFLASLNQSPITTCRSTRSCCLSFPPSVPRPMRQAAPGSALPRCSRCSQSWEGRNSSSWINQKVGIVMMVGAPELSSFFAMMNSATSGAPRGFFLLDSVLRPTSFMLMEKLSSFLGALSRPRRSWIRLITVGARLGSSWAERRSRWVAIPVCTALALHVDKCMISCVC